ncbi:MAG: glycosyltransferase family 4 protein [Pirellulaceae bacterium]
METSRPLRIAVVSTQKQLHGGERQALLLAEGLRTAGHDCRILVRQGSGLASELRRRGLPMESFLGRGRNPFSLWKMRRFISEFRPDVLHYNDSHAITSAGIATSGLVVPCRIASRRVDFPLRSPSRVRHFADGVICVSTATAERCQAAGIAANQLFVVHDGIDQDLAASGNREKGRAALGLSDSVPMILVVGKLTDCKGHSYLLDAMPKIRQAFPMVRTFFAGDGHLEAELRTEIQRRQLDACVTMLGFRTDVPDLMAAADVLAVPSHTEGLCSSIIDALIAECPVVATDCGGIPDVLTPAELDQPCGVLVKTRDATALANGIIQTLADQPAAIQRARAGRQVAERNFTKQQMVERTLAVYQQLLGTQARRAA